MAWLKKRGNVWAACWIGPDGKEVRKSTRVHVKPEARDGGMTAKDLKKLAERVAEGMEGSALGGLSLDLALQAVRAAATGMAVKVVTLGEFGVKFLESRKEQKSFNNSKTAVESLWRLMPDCGSLPLSKFTSAMAEDYVGRALDEVSGATVDRRLNVLSAMFNRAVREKLIEENPFRGCRVPKWALNESREREPFEAEEIHRIFKEFPGEWPDMIAVCLLLGGLRLGDVATLRWEVVDFERELIKVKDGKNNKPTLKPLIKPLLMILQRRRDAAGGWSKYVFPYAQLRYAQAGDKTSKLSTEFGKLLKESGIRGTSEYDERRAGKARHWESKTFHSLRTTSTTFLLDVGCPAELVRHIVGHDDPAIERHHYYKPKSEIKQNYLEKLSDMLGL